MQDPAASGGVGCQALCGKMFSTSTSPAAMLRQARTVVTADCVRVAMPIEKARHVANAKTAVPGSKPAMRLGRLSVDVMYL